MKKKSNKKTEKIMTFRCDEDTMKMIGAMRGGTSKTTSDIVRAAVRFQFQAMKRLEASGEEGITETNTLVSVNRTSKIAAPPCASMRSRKDSATRPQSIQQAFTRWVPELATHHDLSAFHLSLIYVEGRVAGTRPSWAQGILRDSFEEVIRGLVGNNADRAHFIAFAFLDVPGSRRGRLSKAVSVAEVADNYHHHVVLLARSKTAAKIEKKLAALGYGKDQNGISVPVNAHGRVKSCYVQRVGSIDDLEAVTNYDTKALKLLMEEHPEYMEILSSRDISWLHENRSCQPLSSNNCLTTFNSRLS